MVGARPIRVKNTGGGGVIVREFQCVQSGPGGQRETEAKTAEEMFHLQVPGREGRLQGSVPGPRGARGGREEGVGQQGRVSGEAGLGEGEIFQIKLTGGNISDPLQYWLVQQGNKEKYLKYFYCPMLDCRHFLS